jgi:uncharacterized protein YjbI with pentapeptide repeats
MANPEHFAQLQQGIEAWNARRKEEGWNGWKRRFRETDRPQSNPSQLTQVDLSGTNLTDANLYRADFYLADLHDAILLRATLTEADLRGANLSSTNLRGAYLFDANLKGANLEHASLRGADLHGANLNLARLDGADFTDAVLVQTIFGDVDLSVAKGLDCVRHEGPSTVGIDTLQRSRGKIPEVFLRGAGVHDQIITYAKSLVGSAIEFYSCFISYSTKDQPFADRLHADLQANGVRCWFAPHDIAGGRKIHEQIDEAIRLYDRLLLILSDHSMSSEWVKTEIAKARKREMREKRQMLFPVRLVAFVSLRAWECFDGDTGKDSAREIREYFIPDFSNWKDHDSYQKAFERLLRDLKADEAKAQKT